MATKHNDDPTGETVLFALPTGEDDRLNETVITSTRDAAKLERAEQWARSNGFHSFRRVTITPHAFGGSFI